MLSQGLTVADVSILQLPGVRYTVTDHLVHRRAAGLGKVEVIEWRGVAVPLHAGLVDQSINLICGHSRSDGPGPYIQYLSPQLQPRKDWTTTPVVTPPRLTRHATFSPSIS